MAKQNQKANKNPAWVWILRIAIFGTLAVVMVLAVMDYHLKNQASETGVIWRDLLKKANQQDIPRLPEAQLAKSLIGSPDVVKVESPSQNIYTWKGPFRKYQITVNFEPGGSRLVEDIRGPGDDEE